MRRATPTLMPTPATPTAPPTRPRRARVRVVACTTLLALAGATTAAAQSGHAPGAMPGMSPGMHQGMGQGMPPGPGATAGGTGIDTSGDYRQEMQACREGRTAQDRATCMEEARNARAANRRGALDTPASALGANAMARCEGLPPADQAACRARVMGYGRTSGSVAGGGLLRELEVVEMEPGQESVNVAPKGDAPVLVVPAERR